MTCKSARFLIPVLVLTTLVLPLLIPAEVPEKSPRPPKLVVIIIIDQFRNDYLVRFRPHFVARGFNLLLRGANFVNCRYQYAATATGPGHATLLTGAYSDIHGIVGNEWYDRAQKRTVNCVEDAGTRLVDSAQGAAQGPGASPKSLIGSTLGDELRFASDFRSRVVSVSLKDRSAVLAGGHHPDAAYWYNSRTGRFVSSTYYMPALPAWVAEFNSRPPVKDYCGQAWRALPETPGADGKVFSEFSPNPPESCPNDRFLSWLDGTPFMNELQLRFALEAVKNERLGEDSTTDLLIVGLSANDYVGHGYGPYSPEVADLTLLTDRYLADFFNSLDRLIGLTNVWIALSGDHGIAPTPAFIKQHRLGLGNSPTKPVGEAIEGALSQTFGPEKWVEGLASNQVYLSEEAMRRRRVEPARVEAVAAEVALSAGGIVAAFTRTQFLTGTLPDSPLGRKAARSFYPQRGGNVFLVREPYALPKVRDAETTHGSPWNYDAQVPLLLWGSAFRPRTYATPCEPIDFAPTLAVALDLNQPSGAEGRPLVEALRPE